MKNISTLFIREFSNTSPINNDVNIDKLFVDISDEKKQQSIIPNRWYIDNHIGQITSKYQISSNINIEKDQGYEGFASGSAASQININQYLETRTLTLEEVQKRIKDAIEKEEQMRRKRQESEISIFD